MAATNKLPVGHDNHLTDTEYNWLAIAASSFVGRAGSGDIAALTGAQAMVVLSGQAGAAFDLNSQKITNAADGTAAGDLVNKGQLDAALDGLDWQESVLDYVTDNTVAPATEETGDRYILSHDGGAPHANYDGASAGDVVEFGGTTWNATTPNEGYCCRDEDSDQDYVWNGSAWVTKASGTNHNSLASLQGGTSAQYYHLTSARHAIVALLADLTPAANKVPMFSAADAATLVELTASTFFGRKAAGDAVAVTPAEARVILDLDANYVKLVGAADIEITDAAKGVILRDTQGIPHKWRVTIDNSGNLVTADLGAA